MHAGLVDAIDALLPQTQCTKCGYSGCRPYAEAIARDEADINQCPPGGAAGIRNLARLLGRAQKPLNPANGREAPRAVALIDESRCIGCMLCIKACPVDAIVGAAKRMHTVLTAACTGCELCLPPCPVDCIDMLDLDTLAQRGNRHARTLAVESVDDMASTARTRWHFRQVRVAREQRERSERLAKKARDQLADLEQLPASHDLDRKKATVRAAIERARARRIMFGKQ
ncbi:MAG: electron transport complex subunit RsxB [Betaproteobacteria bacterium]|jgi:electron transport complex protein RnfB